MEKVLIALLGISALNLLYVGCINLEERPVFLHCLHGADRTGAMCAIYRTTMEDWSNKEAIKERVF